MDDTTDLPYYICYVYCVASVQQTNLSAYNAWLKSFNMTSLIFMLQVNICHVRISDLYIIFKFLWCVCECVCVCVCVSVQC